MILETALKIIDGREEEYGNIDLVFSTVAKAFHAITLKEITAADVALIQILLKLKRAQSSPMNLDHYVDVAGYSEIMARLAKET